MTRSKKQSKSEIDTAFLPFFMGPLILKHIFTRNKFWVAKKPLLFDWLKKKKKVISMARTNMFSLLRRVCKYIYFFNMHRKINLPLFFHSYAIIGNAD